MDIFSDIFAETLILSIDTLIIGFCVKQLCHCKHIISGLQAAPVLNVDANLKKELTKYPDGIIPYVVLRGSVKALGNPIRSAHNESVTGVIQKLTLKEHVVARTPAGFWSDQARTVHEVFNSMPFVLSSGKIDIEVVDALSADLLDMDVIADKFEPLSPSVIDHLWGFFSGVRQRGLQTMEEMLRDGTYITAVGELSTSDTGSLKIQPPRGGLPLYLTTTTKSILLRKLVNSREFLKILLLVFGSVAMVVSGRIAMKYIKKRRKQEAEEKMKQQLAVGRRERRAQAREKNLDEVQLCVVCAENPKEIILIPCGHVAICEDCSDNIKDVCPVCRHPIESKSPAFIA